MGNKFRVACLQTNSSNIAEENILMLKRIFSKVKSKSYDLICLPECVSIFSDSKKEINDLILDGDLTKLSDPKKTDAFVDSLKKKNVDNKVLLNLLKLLMKQ